MIMRLKTGRGRGIPISCVWIAACLLIGVCPRVEGQIVSTTDARKVAQAWIDITIDREKTWNHSAGAEALEAVEFARGDRLLGYFVPVRPSGYVVVSLRKELAPIKAYSETDCLDPTWDQGMADILKSRMEGVLDAIENQLGPIGSVRSENLAAILDIDYRVSWSEILESSPNAKDYSSGEVMLTTSWYQGEPYDTRCPDLGCNPSNCLATTNAPVGCGATATSQIMKYWCWPPTEFSGFDWPNMPDDFTGCAWPQAEIDAVSDLCSDVGVAILSVYGCAGTSSNMLDIRDAYKSGQFTYSPLCEVEYRVQHSAQEWWDRIVSELDNNRPIQYGIEDHSIVLDGWQEVGGIPIRQYHMNYGWDGWVPDASVPWYCPDWAAFGNSNTWYTLDQLPCSDPDNQFMCAGIVPAVSIFPELNGDYLAGSLNYRYFAYDSYGQNAVFYGGQNLQFLPETKVTCTGYGNDRIRFVGSDVSPPDHYLYLFSHGDLSRGMRFYDGAMNVYGGGTMRVH
ncbi:MAG: C10 family peptidase [Candidatus Eisenbacteria bacterium]